MKMFFWVFLGVFSVTEPVVEELAFCLGGCALCVFCVFFVCELCVSCVFFLCVPGVRSVFVCLILLSQAGAKSTS